MTRVTLCSLIAAVALSAACGKDNTMPGTGDMAVKPGSDLAMGPVDMAMNPPDMAPPKLDIQNCATATVTAASFYSTVINQGTGTANSTCASAGCHVAAGMGATPAMDTMATFIANLKGKPSSATMNYVTPNDVDKSFLLYKITGQHLRVQQFGEQMPSLKPALSAMQQCTIINWVRSGAN